MSTRRPTILRRTPTPRRAHDLPPRRGAIFVTALGIVVILSGLVLVFAQNMRTEALASGNRLAAAQADAVELGAEQWVLGLVEGYGTDAISITQTPAEALPVGGGYFWILAPDFNSDQNYQFNVADESAKISLNTATAEQLLALSSLLTHDVADAIVDWRSPASQASTDGAESAYYNSLPEPYDCKNSEYETVEELLLVKGLTPDLLYGYDRNRNGVIDDAERATGGLSAAFSSAPSDSRGLFSYLTVYSSGVVQGGSPPQSPRMAHGLVNVNTAPQQVLRAMGISQPAADMVIARRAAAPITPAQVRALGPAFTTISSQFSADIVAASGDGRAFRRVRIVIDIHQSNAPVVYRRDLTELGWPLPSAIRDELRAGKAPSQFGAQTGGFGGALP